MEEPGSLQSTGSQKSRTRLSDFTSLKGTKRLKSQPGMTDTRDQRLSFKRSGFLGLRI